jgi:hypothetical protein
LRDFEHGKALTCVINAAKEQHMVTETKDRRINTDAKVRDDGVKRPDGKDAEPRGVMKQAADDLAQGLVDTDLHGMRGQEESVPATGQGQARPQADAGKGMRHHDSVVPSRGKA